MTSSVTITTPLGSVRGFYAVYEWSVWDKSKTSCRSTVTLTGARGRGGMGGASLGLPGSPGADGASGATSIP